VDPPSTCQHAASHPVHMQSASNHACTSTHRHFNLNPLWAEIEQPWLGGQGPHPLGKRQASSLGLALQTPLVCVCLRERLIGRMETAEVFKALYLRNQPSPAEPLIHQAMTSIKALDTTAKTHLKLRWLDCSCEEPGVARHQLVDHPPGNPLWLQQGRDVIQGGHDVATGCRTVLAAVCDRGPGLLNARHLPLGGAAARCQHADKLVLHSSLARRQRLRADRTDGPGKSMHIQRAALPRC